MPAPRSFFWYDFETWGRDPALDRPAQVAGIRTDEELREIGEPLDILCRIPEDYLPHPEACLVHGISPQRADAEGLPEPAFAARLLAELGKPGTCGAGYNSLRFDDEFTRHLLYRNFHDPYEREYRNGNSRWDLIDALRLARLLRPEGIVWPEREGRPSLRLEDLASANGIPHANAHDALADVRATIAMARLLRNAQPRLYDWALRARDKQEVASQLSLREPRPLLHVSSRFPAEQGAAALVLPITQHPVNRNSVIACNLTIDPEPLFTLDAPRLRALLYTRSDDLPTGIGRIPLKEIHLNRCPMLAPAALLTPQIAERVGIDIAACEAAARRLLATPGLAAKIAEVYAEREPGPPRDPEAALYGGFLPDQDRALFPTIRAAGAGELRSQRFLFRDPRLAVLLFRYKARHFPEALDASEREDWQEHLTQRLHGAEASTGPLGCAGFADAIARCRGAADADPRKRALLDELATWGARACAGGAP